jgi:hypothetical protein
LKNKAGTGVVTPVEMEVTCTCIPNGSNKTAAASHAYAAGPVKRLGKKGDATALYWGEHPDSAATSTDGFVTDAKAAVVVAKGDDQGVAWVYFIPSGVGGNKYKVKATVAGVSGESAEVTVWRRIKLDAYEMRGQNHISRHGKTKKIQKYYDDDTFVEYELGDVNELDRKFKVRHIGLWDHATQSERDWEAHSRKHAGEIPSNTETADANGPAGAARTAARAAIQTMVHAWRDRIIADYKDGLKTWAPDAGIPIRSLIAIQFEHPKYSADAPDSKTKEWEAFPWLRIRVEGETIHPDDRWIRGVGLATGNRAYVTDGQSAAQTRNTIAHEAGHVSKHQFKRADFGPVSDHSAAPGLMDETGSLDAFTAREKQILRGEQ